jgi:hypothetical protein
MYLVTIMHVYVTMWSADDVCVSGFYLATSVCESQLIVLWAMVWRCECRVSNLVAPFQTMPRLCIVLDSE